MVNAAVRSMDSANDTDPGAVDNRLSLDPGDARWAKMLESWEDGQDYALHLSIRQISPGEFEVMGLKDRHGMDEAAEEAEEEPAPAARYGKVNPAVMAMDEA